MGYLERQYDDILAEESRIKRNPRFRDNRVHALLYFITPTGHAYVSLLKSGASGSAFGGACEIGTADARRVTLRSLRELDIELMRRLSPRVNVIPVIGKADSLTPSELSAFKKRVRRDPICGAARRRAELTPRPDLDRSWRTLSTTESRSTTSRTTTRRTTRRRSPTTASCAYVGHAPGPSFLASC